MRFHLKRTKLAKALLIAVFWLTATFLFSQQGAIKGKVTDASGAPIIGASVSIEGMNVGTVSDIDGNFSIGKIPAGSIILSASYIGYLKESVTTNITEDQTTEITIQLVEDLQQLSEVVVIGYGTQKKSDLTGAVASVKAEDLQKIPANGISNALQGKTAGVQVSQNTGAPGSSVQVFVRGIPTITAVDGVNQGQAKWIVDGIPMSPNSVNPSDIESIEVLKDAASAAIYGSGGGTGMILVTTKKGKKGKPQVNLNYYHGIQHVPNRIEMANGPEFGQMYTEMQGTRYQSLPLVDPRNRKKYTFPNYDTLPSYDYQDMIFKDAAVDNLDFSVSGGNENVTTYLGISYLNQKGILDKTSYQKFNIRLNTTYKVNKWFSVGENIVFTQSENSGWEEWEYQNEYRSPIMNAIGVHPYLAPYDETGNFVPRENGGGSESPLPAISIMNKATRRYEGNGTVFVLIEPVKGLTFESKINGYTNFMDNHNFNPTYRYGSALGEFNDIDQIWRRMEKYMGYTWQNIASYNTTIANSFNVGVMAGFEVKEDNGLTMGAMRQYLFTEDPNMWYFDASTDDTSGSQIINLVGSGNKNTQYSYLGRLNIDYKGKYLFQANFRRDASSKFGPENRIGNFPGISAGWKFSEEGFVRDNISFLTFGKLRYSWGKTGINAIRDYAYYPTVSGQATFSYFYDNGNTLSPGAGPDVLVDPRIHWEEVVSQDFGIDLSFIQNKLNLTFDWFERHNNGMLLPQTPPGYGGWTVRDPSQEAGGIDARPVVNIGNMVNKGWEFSVGYKSSAGKLKYSVDVNYTRLKNKAESLGDDSIRYAGTCKSIPGFINHTLEGGGIGDFWGYTTDGLFRIEDAILLEDGTYQIVNQPFSINTRGDTVYAQKDAQPGDIRFVDMNKDGVLNQDDMGVIGNPQPKHLLGLTLNLEYGWFDFQVFFEGKFGQKIFNGTRVWYYNRDGEFNWLASYVNDHYRADEVVATDNNGNIVATFPENRNSGNPRFDVNNDNNNFGRSSTFYIEDGSYLRMKNIQLGVSLPQSWLNKISLEQFRIYVGATNLLTFTKYTGMDPEVPQGSILDAGIDKAAYPVPRTYIVGINLKF